MIIISYTIMLFSAILFLVVAITDFLSWKIRNIHIYMLVILFFLNHVLVSLAGIDTFWRPTLPSSIAASGLLFALGFTLWAFKLLGAGDAKLLAPIGLFLGWSNMIKYSLFLLLFAIVAGIALRYPLPMAVKMTRTGMRLAEIRQTGKVPYGVLMVAALFATLLHSHREMF